MPGSGEQIVANALEMRTEIAPREMRTEFRCSQAARVAGEA